MGASTASVHIKLSLDYKSDEDWPFDFKAEQRFELRRNQLIVSLCLTNTGRQVMLGGLGWHPYFLATNDRTIRLDATREWHPFRQDGPTQSVGDVKIASRIDLEAGRTQHYFAWKRATALIGSGARITLEGDEFLTCLAALQRDDYLCLEPVSHVAGALENMDTASDTGLRILAPGECIRGMARLSIF